MFDEIVRGIEIFSYLMTILYFVTFNNKPNKKVVLSLMATNRFEQYVYRSADFIQQISDFDHIKAEDRFSMINAIVECYCDPLEQGRHVLRYLKLMMFDQQSKPKRNWQCIIARVVIRKLSQPSFIDSGDVYGGLMFVLAHAAISNHQVSIQC